MPSGATILVEVICALFMITFSSATGRAILKPSRIWSFRKRTCSPARRCSAGDFTSRKKSIAANEQALASPVPSAAPATPSPAPGSVIPISLLSGKIRNMLKTTSSMHIPTWIMPGMIIFPVDCRKFPAVNPALSIGKKMAKMRKYRDASAQMLLSPPSQTGR